MAKSNLIVSIVTTMSRLPIDFKNSRRLIATSVVLLFGSVNALASVGVWNYAGVNYPTQAAALAAMHSVSARNAVLTQNNGASAMNPAIVRYTYVAPTTVTATQNPYWYCGQTSPPGCQNSGTEGAPFGFSTLAQVADAFAQYLLPLYNGAASCPYTTTVSTAWTLYNSGTYYQPNLVLQEDLSTVSLVGEFTNVSPPCNTPLTGQSNVSRTRTVTCPDYYTVNNPGQGVSNNNPIFCTDADSDFISYQLLECPANGSLSTYIGDPCDVSTGDFSQTEPDYSSAGLHFDRYYHSAVVESIHGLGAGWTHNYGAYLILTNGIPTGLLRPNGHHDALAISTSGVYISLSGASIHVQHSGANWTATLKDGSSEIYDSTGKLIQMVTSGGLITTVTYSTSNQLKSVSDPFGHALQFSYNSSNQLQSLIDSAGKTIVYGYGSHNNLTTVTYQDNTKRTYLYENSTFPNSLTGIVDENNSRFLTVGYDSTTGAVRSSQQAGGVLAVSIVYNTNTAVVTDSLGATDTYTFTSSAGYAPRVTSLSRSGLIQSFTVPAGATDAQRRVTQSTDANGNITKYAFDTNHLTSKTEAFGTTVARTTSYQYLSTTSALPTLITEWSCPYPTGQTAG